MIQIQYVLLIGIVLQVTKVAKFLGFNTTVEDKKTGKYKDSVLEDHLKRQKGIDDEFLEI